MTQEKVMQYANATIVNEPQKTNKKEAVKMKEGRKASEVTKPQEISQSVIDDILKTCGEEDYQWIMKTTAQLELEHDADDYFPELKARVGRKFFSHLYSDGKAKVKESRLDRMERVRQEAMARA